MFKGNVKWFNAQRGYGFINMIGDTEHDIFVHFTQINQTGYKTLSEGDAVEFELVHTNRGDQAHNVSRTMETALQ